MAPLLIWILKLLGLTSRLAGFGAGSTWPGHIMLLINPSFLKKFNANFKGKIIVVAGTNGKTTTSKLIRTILEEDHRQVIHNESGANLLNGIVSAIIQATSWSGRFSEIAVFEVDENFLPLLLEELKPDILVILNLFRDQLDRYGEVNTIAIMWKKALQSLPKTTTIILNANDPEIAFLGKDIKAFVKYFGLSNKHMYLARRPHAMDVVNCPSCQSPLLFEGIYLGHLGNWKCSSCSFSEPEIDFGREQSVLPGIYNIYNTQAATLVAETLGISQKTINAALTNFTPVFGRQETFVVDRKKIKIFLSKNPTGFNESLRTIKELGAKYILVVLNDRIPDGRDVSWIWDVDFEEFLDNNMQVHVSGDRASDMTLRLKYAHPVINHVDTHELLDRVFSDIVKNLPTTETLYILPTYSAMLEVRKILGGRKIP